jgi:hypothetical protein
MSHLAIPFGWRMRTGKEGGSVGGKALEVDEVMVEWGREAASGETRPYGSVDPHLASSVWLESVEQRRKHFKTGLPCDLPLRCLVSQNSTRAGRRWS